MWCPYRIVIAFKPSRIFCIFLCKFELADDGSFFHITEKGSVNININKKKYI